MRLGLQVLWSPVWDHVGSGRTLQEFCKRWIRGCLKFVRHRDAAAHVAPRNQRSSTIKTRTRKPKTRGTTGAESLIVTPACTNKATIDGSTLPANFSNREVGQSSREAFAKIARALAHDLAQNGSRVGPSLFTLCEPLRSSLRRSLRRACADLACVSTSYATLSFRLRKSRTRDLGQPSDDSSAQ